MREILFRGKRKDGRGWVSGYLFDDGMIDSNRMFVGLIVIEDTDDGPDVTGIDFHEVITETVCRYTGLTDKNGRKIFEGDIVNCYKRGTAFRNCKVVWNEADARFDVVNKDCGFPMCLDGYGRDIFIIRGLDYEVIGDIFDNPELINGDENND